jgi:hypothetical protein
MVSHFFLCVCSDLFSSAARFASSNDGSDPASRPRMLRNSSKGTLLRLAGMAPSTEVADPPAVPAPTMTTAAAAENSVAPEVATAENLMVSAMETTAAAKNSAAQTTETTAAAENLAVLAMVAEDSAALTEGTKASSATTTLATATVPGHPASTAEQPAPLPLAPSSASKPVAAASEATVAVAPTTDTSSAPRKSASLVAAEGKAAQAKLAETRETGAISSNVYLTYAASAGGGWVILWLLLMFLIHQAGRIGADWWLALWSSNAISPAPTIAYVKLP